MEQGELTEKLKEIICPVLKQESMLLVELRFIRTRGSCLLRLLVDREDGGITLGDCSQLNEKIGLALDSADILEQRYILEVSSPGIDRLLKTKNDFLRCLNKKIKIFLRERIVGRLELEGIVSMVEKDSVVVNIEGGDSLIKRKPLDEQTQESLQIPLSNIAKAKQMIKA